MLWKFHPKGAKESVFNNLPCYLTPPLPLHEWRGGEWVSYFVLILKFNIGMEEVS